MTTSRTDFNESWLSGVPQTTNNIEAYNSLIYDIQLGNKSIDIGDNYKKLNNLNECIYWLEKNGTVLLGCKFHRTAFNLTMYYFGKNSDYQENYLDTYNLYKKILDEQKIVRIMNPFDKINLNIWQQLLSNGYLITLYNIWNPWYMRKILSTKDELEQYFEDDYTYRYYQFAISNKKQLGEIVSQFNTRMLRELTGMGVDDIKT